MMNEGALVRRHDHVGLDERRFQLIEGSRLSTHARRDLANSLSIPTDDEEARAGLAQEARHGFSHVARADERHGVAERSRDLKRARSTTASRTETCPAPIVVSGAHALGGLYDAGNDPIQNAARGPDFSTRSCSGLHLPGAICGSPTTRESSEAATRKRWRTASWPSCW